MITKWIWTFGGDVKLLSDKYVVINGDEGAGREYVFKKYGRMNCCMDYPYDYGMEKVVNRYGLKLLEEVDV